MKKILKKVTAAVMAAVMTVGIAASVNAAEAQGNFSAETERYNPYCQHSHVYRVRENKFTRKSMTTHTFYVIHEDGLVKEECIHEVRLYDCSYYCRDCGDWAGTAGTDEVHIHSNPHCNA